MTLGLVRIALNCIQFDDPSQKGIRDLDGSNVQRLLRVFEIEGCNQEAYPVSALIPQDVFHGSASHCNLSPDDLERGDKFLELPEGFKILCIHGRHRLEAANLFLPVNKRWWAVQLFRQGNLASLLCHIALTTFRNGYRGSGPDSIA